MGMLDRRIEALEIAGCNAVGFISILCEIVTPGAPQGEAAFAEALGQRFKREPTETESDFIERVRVLVDMSRAPGRPGAQIIISDRDLAL